MVQHRLIKTFDNASVRLAVQFLLDNCFFNVNNSSFQQVIGINMGPNPVCFLENLFLYYYDYHESEWLLDTKKKEEEKARFFSNLFHFIDNLCATKNHLEIDENL